uniref:Uncharacterized protein n=1 Tax=Myoviridae sp. cts9u10 TaxID=2825187 RepID=A0A8S5NXH6_9CAUD|nr:MAG TPA: hypothetical protein [Myoviridae sp. cts9u10]
MSLSAFLQVIRYVQHKFLVLHLDKSLNNKGVARLIIVKGA